MFDILEQGQIYFEQLFASSSLKQKKTAHQTTDFYIKLRRTYNV